MSEHESALLLLDMAEKDLLALGGMQDPQVFAEEVFGFHAQQAAEKVLKAWIATLGEQYPLTHNLAALLARLENLGVEVGALWGLVDLNPFGVQFRYEAMDDTEPPLERRALVPQLRGLAQQVRVLTKTP